MGDERPSREITGSDGDQLAGKRIVLCVSGSVAAYKAIELARLMMRRGADVRCVASPAAARLLRPAYLRWATGNPVVTKLTGGMEHVALADYGKSDMIVVYPATANTLGRLANGMDDAPVSSVLTVGFGAGMPILLAPAMHAAMYGNPAVRRNVDFLKGRAELVGPVMREGKARAAEPAEVLERVVERLCPPRALRGRRALVVAGPTAERIDPARSVVSESSGRTGVKIASELAAAGASVSMVYGPGAEEPPAGVRVRRVVSASEMAAAVSAELRRKCDIVVVAAAVSDYAPAGRRSKIPSGLKELSVRMTPTPKIIDSVKKARPGAFLVGFKAEAGVSARTLESRARKKMRAADADIVVANDISRVSADRGEVLMVGRGWSKKTGRRTKAEIARIVVREIGERL